MKRNIVLLGLWMISISLPAQNQTDSVRIQECFEISRTDPTKWIQRYQNDIERYIDENRKLQNKSCDVLILGSSSMGMWKTVYEDLAPLKVIRRSYGGATIRDMLYYYDVIARSYNPKKILFYVGNDIGVGGDVEMSVGDTYDLVRVFIRRLHRDYPKAKLYVISLRPSIIKKRHLDKELRYNSLLKEFAEKTPDLVYIDVAKGMYDEKGNLRTDVFIEDGLHLNEKGYEVWTSIIRSVLME